MFQSLCLNLQIIEGVLANNMFVAPFVNFALLLASVMYDFVVIFESVLLTCQRFLNIF